jgi:alkylation response protein AidB-like acyl-CoA dehydrogenase
MREPPRERPANAEGTTHELVRAARALAPRIRERADEIERERRLPTTLVRTLAQAGVFRMLVPAELGGFEVDPSTMVGCLAEIARADGSAGWCAMIGATTGVIGAYLPAAVGREIYGTDPEVVTGGVFHPRGVARAEGAAYRLTGRWPFASGCQHCAWLLGGAIVRDGDRPRLQPSGAPETRQMVFPASEAEVIDTWSVSGLRGSGSHDIAVKDILVPRERTVSLTTDRPRIVTPLYAFPVFGLLALGIAAVALGIAERAIEELVALAGGKIPTGGRRPIALRSAVQTDVARAQGLVRAARALLLDSIGEAWRSARAGDAIRLEERALVRLAATHATRSCAEAVDLMYEAGGGSSIYEGCALQRLFRDVHVATQHVMVAPPTLELVGRVLLGAPGDTELL